MYVAITRAKDQVIILYNNKNASQFVSQSQLAKADFKVGDMILHKAFGKGRIVNTDSKYIQIEFPEKNRTMKFNFEYAITKNIIFFSCHIELWQLFLFINMFGIIEL